MGLKEIIQRQRETYLRQNFDKSNNVNYNPGVYYRGTIKGNPNSLASFSFFNDQLFGIISDDAFGNITVGRVVRPGNTSEYIIYTDRNLIQPMNLRCQRPAAVR